MQSSQTWDIELSNGHKIPCRFLDAEGTEWWMDQLKQRPHVEVSIIGNSRSGREMFGVKAGSGPIKVSVTAGAHADEPAGPVAGCALAWLMSEPDAGLLREQYTFVICPQVNPDGAEANKRWFSPTPHLETYLRHVKREAPGDDIEFGYPGDGKGALRPENQAVADFLSSHGPYNVHASLHSMGTAEGAWFLIEKSWVEQTQPLRQRLAELARRHGLELHDIQRNGQKGFNRISRGFCTTPTSTAMRQFFRESNDIATAEKFHLSSMEYVKSLGGNPLAVVTEFPNFTLSSGDEISSARAPGPEGDEGPAPGETLYEQCRDRIKIHMDKGDIQGAIEEARHAGATPVPFAKHVTLQVETVLAACEYVRASDLPHIATGVLSDTTTNRAPGQ